MEKKRIRQLLIVSGVCLLALVCYHLFIEYHTEITLLLKSQVSEKALMHNVRSHGIRSGVLLVLLTIVMCALPGLPTSVIGIFIGLCYGPLIGSILNIIGNAVGNLISMVLLRKLKFLDKRNTSNHWVQAITQMRHPKIGIMFAYMIPVIPSFIVNFTANLLKMKTRHLFLAVLVGVTPSSVMYALGGDAIFKGLNKKALLLIASVAILILLIQVIYKDAKKKTIV
ncbi:TVP38/TMEM64 family protein [Tetragenococcus koreensis]|uniref:TVP38/TMEM64 family protein n=1 Tax=Tetragenococcus koreensis TaxID=290335 RepID=UPI000F50CF1B|nr:VTT domain-containing protein [Tetragenococcus koreensis]AYW46346.1 TVP38/TMEM64 family protein [Tetragenococcus koreensis]GEN90253.1 TVP38/TMEM64 family protein [Tetragenococcus koreensis]